MMPHLGLDRRSVLGSLLVAAPAAAQPAPNQSAEADVVASEAFGADSQVALDQIDQALRRLADVIKQPPSDDFDGDLADKIIAFHQTSIDVAQVILSTARDPQLRALAADNINQEAAAIANIRTWIENRVQAPDPPQ
jgi:uncharacterized protein (DUF305 family)